MLVALLLLCLSVSAQTEYSGIAGASPRMVKANKQSSSKQTTHSTKAGTSSTTMKSKPANVSNADSNNSTYAPLPDDKQTGETEVKDGFKPSHVVWGKSLNVKQSRWEKQHVR